MTSDGDPRQHTRLALWLGVSLLLHAVAVPLLRSAATTNGSAGPGLQVTLTGAAPASPGASTPSAGSSTPVVDDPVRERRSERRREPRTTEPAAVAATTSSAEPATPVAHEAEAVPARLAEGPRTEPAPSLRPPLPGAMRTDADPPEAIVAMARVRPRVVADPLPARTAATAVGNDEPGAARPAAEHAGVAAATRLARERPASERALATHPPSPPVATGSPAGMTLAARVEEPLPDATRTEAPRVQKHEPATTEPTPAVVTRSTEPVPESAPPGDPVMTTPAAVREPEPEPLSMTADAYPAVEASAAVVAPGEVAAAATTASAAGEPDLPTTLAGAAGSTRSSIDTGGERTLLALLHRAIDDRKRYPRLARRQRREGSATVLFRLHPDGALDRLELAASSGFDLLDKAALRAVADVAPFAPATRYLTRDKQFRVEVEFRLF